MKPEQKTIRIALGDKLAYYRQKADASYWDSHWKSVVSDDYYKCADKGDLGNFEDIFTKYLPKDQLILEAGCGLGDKVLALHRRGYRVEGVDTAQHTITKVNSMFPELKINLGDVCNLPVPDGTYGAYISLGVIEHRFEGPEPFLCEAHRVLRDDGIAVITMPWFSLLRKFKARIGMFRGLDVIDLKFYQYAYGTCAMRKHLESAGFNVVESIPSNAIMGFEDELNLDRLYAMGKLGHLLKKVVRRLFPLITKYSGHSIRFVCKKM